MVHTLFALGPQIQYQVRSYFASGAARIGRYRRKEETVSY